jgi:tRNA dimethylallyltransferase
MLMSRATLPVAVGGPGLYLDAVLQQFRMVETPEDGDLRRELGSYSDDQLALKLRSLKPKLHNTTDLTERSRMIRAIEIALHARDNPPSPAPDIRPLVLGARWERSELRARIHQRLKDRLDQGLIGEVEHLLGRGVGRKRLHSLGLEYRYVSDYLGGVIKNKNDLMQKLGSAICQYARRQDTWFRRMEKNGTEIHWIDRGDPHAAMVVCQEQWHSPG